MIIWCVVPKMECKRQKFLSFWPIFCPFTMWGSTKQFSVFFLNKNDCVDHMAPILETLTTQSLLSGCKNDCFIVHMFLSNKPNQSCSRSLHKNGPLWAKRDSMAIEKPIQISPARTVKICDMHKSNSGFCTSQPRHVERNNSQLKLFLKTPNVFV